MRLGLRRPDVDEPSAVTGETRPVRGQAGLVFGVSFVSLLALLLARNHVLFTLAVHERGDAAANSIITDQAKHFELLVGNYSRLGFSHPGPAFFYCQAFGEWLFYDILRLVPAPWNGQWLALLALNAALLAITLMILRSWSAGWPPVALCGAAALLFCAAHDNLLSSAWMPYLYIAPFLLFLTAASSVAAGRTAHLWAFVLAGGLLVHGHAEFLFFVPAIAVCALAALWYVTRGRRVRQRRRDWLVAAGVLAVFLLPLVLNLALHWPGEFARYFGYGDERGLHGAGATTGYLLGFWAGSALTAGALVIVLFGGVAALGRLLPPGELRSFLTAGLGAAVLGTVLFAGYTARGIDDLSQDYVGYFYRAVPLFLLLLAVLGVAPGRAGREYGRRRTLRTRAIRLFVRLRTIRLPIYLRTVRLPLRLRSMRIGALWAAQSARRQAGTRQQRPARVLAVAALAAGYLVAAWSPSLATAPDHLPELPRVLATLTGYTEGRPVVVDLDHAAWPVLTGLLVAGDRAGQRVCAQDQGWRFMVTSEFVCTGRDLAEGRPVWLGAQPAPGGTVLADLDGWVLSTTTASG